MPQQTLPAIGTFAWNELMTTDAKAALGFYTQLFGWSTRDMDMGPAGVYTVVSADGKDLGGVMQMGAEFGGTGSYWMGYIHVTDIEARAKTADALGATTIVPVSPIPNVGRFAIFQDPTGAKFGILQYDTPA